MRVVMDEEFQKTLDRIGKRKWWPVAELAQVLGRPKKYVYRKVEGGKFAVLNDGGYMKVVSKTVVRYFFEKQR